MNKKILTGLIVFLVSFSLRGAVTLEKVAGEYEVTVPGLPITNLVSLGEDGAVLLLEEGPYGELECEGSAQVIDGNIIQSEVTCANGMTFTQRINLQGVSDYDNFSAPLFSSLYKREIMADFKRVMGKSVQGQQSSFVGKYKLVERNSHDNYVLMSLEESGEVIYEMYSETSGLLGICKGDYKMDGNMVNIEMVCKGGGRTMAFPLQIDIAGVTDFDDFTAKVANVWDIRTTHFKKVQ